MCCRLRESLTTYQDASGELAGMAIGASLWGFANQILENGDNIRTQRAHRHKIQLHDVGA